MSQQVNDEDTETKETDQDDVHRNSYYQQTDEEFEAWVLQQMISLTPQLQELYPDLFQRAAQAVRKWRQRYQGNVPCWNRLFKPDRVLKEVVESVPIVALVLDWMDRHVNENSAKVTVVDLCSGKGYLSMLLSEILPPEQVDKCLLIDKAWPMCHHPPKPHHISWEHIYGTTGTYDTPNDQKQRHEQQSNNNYFESWPIPLVTSKQDLKQSRTLSQLKERFADTPVLILAVHLCGTLSLQAIKLFLELPTAPLMVLKPCCLPEISHVKRSDHFQVGAYCFPTCEVCAPGKWTGSKTKNWKGPPRWHLQPKFDKWCHYLHQAMEQQQQQKSLDTRVLEVPLQIKGGFQNTILVAERTSLID